MCAALGIAAQAGCLTVILAVAALLLGLWLDQVLGTRRIFALICVAVSVAIALFVTLRVTQRLIARIIRPDKLKQGFRSMTRRIKQKGFQFLTGVYGPVILVTDCANGPTQS